MVRGKKTNTRESALFAQGRASGRRFETRVGQPPVLVGDRIPIRSGFESLSNTKHGICAIDTAMEWERAVANDIVKGLGNKVQVIASAMAHSITEHSLVRTRIRNLIFDIMEGGEVNQVVRI